MLSIAIQIILICLLNISFSKQQTTTNDNSKIERENNCKCVKYFLCDSENYIITSGETLFNVRFGGDEDNKSVVDRIACNVLDEACCKLRSANSNITSKSPTDPIEQQPLECGQQIEDDYFPWIVEVFGKAPKKDNFEYKCSGSLIAPNAVLTTTTCVKLSQDYVVVGGASKSFKEFAKADSTAKLEVVKKVLHPNFSSGTLRYNVAILFLKESFQLSRETRINTVCILERIESHFLQAEKTCTAAGFNYLKDTNKLKRVDLTLLDGETCQKDLRKSRLGANYKLQVGSLCAHGTDAINDNCDGDGGSPLMCLENAVYFQVGLVNWGPDCGNPKIPGIYTNITSVLDWIRKEIRIHKLFLSN